MRGSIRFWSLSRATKKVRKILLLAKSTTIGRASRMNVRLRDPLVSSEHAVIIRDAAKLSIKDTGSTNGTHVNGRKVEECMIEDGAKIVLGETEMMLVVPKNRASRS
ncbi:MAG: FHA domain-containing protein [Deltaproteobacteria bacterium]|nr:FHA domain-containing protein [Deltaproteobacteria bacterium]